MDGKNERMIFSGVIYLSLIAGALICSCLNRLAVSDAFLHTGYALIIGAVFMVLLHGKEDMLWKQIPDKLLYMIIVAIGSCLTGLASRYSVGILWLLPLAVVGCLEALEIKLATFGLMMIAYLCNALLVHEQIYLMIFYLVMGTAMLLILSMLKEMGEIPYAGVILMALSLAMTVLQNHFDMERIRQERYQIILELSSILFLVLFHAIVQVLVGENAIRRSEEKMELELVAMMQDDFSLMQKLKENPDLYRHSYKISRLSVQVAKLIAGDSMLAGAGGMYHEIGRLIDEKNYMDGNMVLAEKYQFPQALTDVIRQHNTGSEIPKSPEAAIVMLSDCIISTGDYLDKSGKRKVISNEKLVRSIFSNRIAKGSLAEAGLSDEQIETIQEFYIKHAFSS